MIPAIRIEILSLVALAVGVSSIASAAEPPVRLADRGRPDAAVIVSSRQAGKLGARTSLAAGVLVDHLTKMSGATLPLLHEDALKGAEVKDGRLVVADPAANGATCFVLVGAGRLTDALGITADQAPPGGVLIKTVGNTVALIGSADPSDPNTTQHAIYEFLELLGCRYLWPGPTGKVIPKKPTIELDPISHAFAPPIRQRNIRWAGWKDGMEDGLATLGITRSGWDAARKTAWAGEEPRDWLNWHRNGGNLGISGGHAFGAAWERWGKEHPEWFALQPDGTRDQSAAGQRCRLCVSNAGLIDAVAADVIERVRNDPTLRSVSLSPNDGGYSSFCMCDNCKKLDPPDGPKIKLLMFKKVGAPERDEIDYVSLTDRYVYFWNAIAERVVKVHPKLLLVVDAYSTYQHAPVKLTLHPNLVVRYVPSTAAEWDGWKKRAKQLYWRPNILLNGRRDGMLVVTAGSLADTFHQLVAGGAIATDFDSIIDNWAIHGLNYYVAARLNWNPSLKYEDVLRDYCQAGFGPAAEPVEKYFIRAADATDPYRKVPAPGLEEKRIGELRQLLTDAEKLAGRDAEVLARLAMLRAGLDFTGLQVQLNALSAKATADQAYDRDEARRLMTLNFRMLRDMARRRPLAINVPMLMSLTGNYAKWRPIGWPELASQLAKSAVSATAPEAP